MRESNFSFPQQNKASVCISSALYDRRAIDCTAILPLINSLTHLAYLTSTSPRIREILTVDGGLERLVRILRQPPVSPPSKAKSGLVPPSSSPNGAPDRKAIWKWSLAFQCVVNVGVRGSENVRTRVVEAGMIPVIIKVLESYLRVQDTIKDDREREWKEREARDRAQRDAVAFLLPDGDVPTPRPASLPAAAAAAPDAVAGHHHAHPGPVPITPVAPSQHAHAMPAPPPPPPPVRVAPVADEPLPARTSDTDSPTADDTVNVVTIASDTRPTTPAEHDERSSHHAQSPPFSSREPHGLRLLDDRFRAPSLPVSVSVDDVAGPGSRPPGRPSRSPSPEDVIVPVSVAGSGARLSTGTYTTVSSTEDLRSAVDEGASGHGSGSESAPGDGDEDVEMEGAECVDAADADALSVPIGWQTASRPEGRSAEGASMDDGMEGVEMETPRMARRNLVPLSSTFASSSADESSPASAVDATPVAGPSRPSTLHPSSAGAVRPGSSPSFFPPSSFPVAQQWHTLDAPQRSHHLRHHHHYHHHHHHHQPTEPASTASAPTSFGQTARPLSRQSRSDTILASERTLPEQTLPAQWQQQQQRQQQQQQQQQLGFSFPAHARHPPSIAPTVATGGGAGVGAQRPSPPLADQTGGARAPWRARPPPAAPAATAGAPAAPASGAGVPSSSSSAPAASGDFMIYREEDVLLSLQLLAYLSKYSHVRTLFHDPDTCHLPFPHVFRPKRSASASSSAKGKEAGVGESVDGDGDGDGEADGDGDGDGEMEGIDREADADGDGNGSSASAAADRGRGDRRERHAKTDEERKKEKASRAHAAKKAAAAAAVERNEPQSSQSQNQSWTPSSPPKRNVFSVVERFTLRTSPSDRSNPRLAPEIQYWAGVIMRNACRKDENRGGIRQCANMFCGRWEAFPREFAKCRRCRKAKYCSKACQSKAWQMGHRFWCSARSEGHGAGAGGPSAQAQAQQQQQQQQQQQAS